MICKLGNRSSCEEQQPAAEKLSIRSKVGCVRPDAFFLTRRAVRVEISGRRTEGYMSRGIEAVIEDSDGVKCKCCDAIGGEA